MLLTKHSQSSEINHDGGNPVSFNGPWIPGLHSASPGMTILINRQATPAQTKPTTPAAPGIAKRHRPDGPRPDPAVPNKNSSLSVDARNAPHPKGNSVAAWQAHVPPMMTDLSASPNGSIGPLATDPASRSPPANPGNRASRPRADPIRAQFGPADSRHCHASPTGLNWTEPNWPRLSLPRSNALAPRAQLSRHDKPQFFANIRRPYGLIAPPP
ncbi:hypothetical protein ABIE64_002909 [Thalassospira sp. MBR-102]